MSAIPPIPASQAAINAAFAQAVAALQERRLEDARRLCLGLLRAAPRHADLYAMLGAIEHQAGDFDAAIAHFRRCLKLQPEQARHRLNLAKVLRDGARWGEAAREFRAALRGQPQDPAVLIELARAETKCGQLEAARQTYAALKDIGYAPDAVDTELAEVMLRSGDVDGAEQRYRAVLSRNPTFAPAMINLAVLCDMTGRTTESLEWYAKAATAQPQNAEAQVHYALALLARERLAEGFGIYGWRFKRAQTSTLHGRFAAPYWQGEQLEGKRLLIWTEQGPGDEILLAGMVRDVLRRGASCTLVCTQRLVPLFRRSFPEVGVVAREDVATIEADYQASLSELGRILRPDLNAFPHHAGYLCADPAHTAALRSRYKAETGPLVVGIAWHSANLQASQEKSTDLREWRPILAAPGVRFVSLQYGARARELTQIGAEVGGDVIVDRTIDGLKSIDDLAAQVAAMDLVISVSSTTVHLAGALGKPVWTLVPASTGRIWYWFLDRSDSPWYPAMRLFRQRIGEPWGAVLQRVAAEFRS